ncbi:MAG: rod shape-determining protein RodA [Acidobacteriota bacterium]
MPLIDRRFLADLDYLLLGAVLALVGFGLLGISSAAGPAFLNAQLSRVFLGLAICFAVALIDYHRLTQFAPLFYVIAVALLAATLLLGSEIKGSKSWIVLMGFRFQPSELVKVAVILALARYLGELRENLLSLRQIVGLGLLFSLPVMLVVLQGDMGTALMYFPILGGMMLVAGLRLRFWVAMLLICALLAPLGWFMLHDYQRERILVTFNPDLDPQGVGYQVRQSKIAIGSGGWTGKGLGQGSQSRLGFVPEIRTDFIFALLAEEHGFLGAAAILLLYLFVLFRITGAAELSRDRTGLLIVTGVGSLLFAHVVTNVGMTLGLLPAIGVPLPFVSYGGSAMLAMFAAIGLVFNVRYRRFVY